MTTAATSLLGLALPVTGELSGTWGDTVNNSITSLLDTAVAGTTTLSTDADVTLTTTTLASNQARQAILLCSGARTALRTITAPAQSKIYTIINATTGGYSVKLVGVGPTTGLTIPNGASAVVAWNGSDFIEVGSATVGNLTVNGNLSVTGTTSLTGVATLTANPVLSAGTANGVAYLNGSKVVTTGSALTFDGSVLTLAPNQVTFGGSTILALGSGSYFKAASTNGFLVNNAADTLNFFKIDASGNAIFYPGGSEQMRLTSTGLGIGTSSPGVKLDVAGAIRSTVSGGTPIIYFNNGTTQHSISNSSGSMPFAIDGSEGMRLTSTGLGIGTSSPAYKLQVAGVISSNDTVRVSDGTTTTIMSIAGTGEGIVGTSSNHSLQLRTNNTAKATLDSSGNLGIGTSSPNSKLQVQGLIRTSSSAAGLQIDRRDTSASAYTLYSTAGNLQFYNGTSDVMTLDASGNLGVGTTSPVGNFNVNTTGNTQVTISAGSTGLSRLVFQGQVSNNRGFIDYDNTSSVRAMIFRTDETERMRIDSSGNLLIGTTSSDGSRLRVYGSYQTLGDGSYEGLIGKASSLVSGGGAGEFAIRSSSNLLFATNGNTERARIDTSGNLLVGATSVNGLGGTTLAPGYALWNSSNNNTTRLFFQYNSTTIGSVTTTATATAYNTSSDYRLKESIAPMTGALAKVAALKPVTYKWKADGSDGEGFIAHELAEVVPQCVTGEKDAVDEEGKPQYQGIDTSFLVATLTAALQEAHGLIKDLQSRVAVLEAK